MLSSKALLSMIAGAIDMCSPAFAQEETPAYKNEASVQPFGSFVKSTTSNGVDQTATNSGGVLASYRFLFNAHNGIEANYGYGLNTQNYRGFVYRSPTYNLTNLDGTDRVTHQAEPSIGFGCWV
jgi:hypothetical protein